MRHQPDDPTFPPHLAARRLASTVAAGAAGAAATAPFVAWQAALTIGWTLAAVAYLARVWTVVLRHDAGMTANHATRLDESRWVADAILLTACLASLAAVAVLLVKGAQRGGTIEALFTALAVASIIASWAVVQTIFALHYGRLYYCDGAGLSFSSDRGDGDDRPTYADFAYVAFTIGMTYQVSDTAVTTRATRATVLRHALLSFVFGTAIIAMTINVVAGLLR